MQNLVSPVIDWCRNNWQFVFQSVFGALISVAGLWIAVQQTRIARTHLNHEQYDRKFRVYGGAKGLLSAFQVDGKITRSALQNFNAGVADAEFLFDAQVLDYLQELRERAAKSIFLDTRLGSDGLPQAERDRYVEAEAANSQWFVVQSKVVQEKFKTAMQL